MQASGSLFKGYGIKEPDMEPHSKGEVGINALSCQRLGSRPEPKFLSLRIRSRVWNCDVYSASRCCISEHLYRLDETSILQSTGQYGGVFFMLGKLPVKGCPDQENRYEL